MFSILTKNNFEIINPFLRMANLPIINVSEFDDNPFLNVVTYSVNNEIVGYLNYSIIYDRVELNQIYVIPNYRNRGIGILLMEYLLKVSDKCTNITLEVRKDNIPAINLYKKFNFKECGIRKNYYGDIDGLLMIYERSE